MAVSLLDPEYILRTFSYIGLAGAMFAETGLLVGFFLPGDSLLLTAGIFAARGDLNLALIALLAFLGAVLGNTAGYALGHRFGPRVFARGGRLFRPQFVEEARAYFEKHGNQTLILSRFVPVVRTVVPTLAGTTHMNFRLFCVYNVIGALLWAVGVPIAGYFLGRVIPKEILDKYILVIVGAVLVLSFVPVGLELLRRRART